MINSKVSIDLLVINKSKISGCELALPQAVDSIDLHTFGSEILAYDFASLLRVGEH
jgi:hypothetical protein